MISFLVFMGKHQELSWIFMSSLVLIPMYITNKQSEAIKSLIISAKDEMRKFNEYVDELPLVDIDVIEYQRIVKTKSWEFNGDVHSEEYYVIYPKIEHSEPYKIKVSDMKSVIVTSDVGKTTLRCKYDEDSNEVFKCELLIPINNVKRVLYI